MLPFSADTRRTDLERMAQDRVDVLVVGGGITGCGIALDAASRGLSVALVERDDFASGTSGRSSRFVHGGVRYLEHYEFRLVHESLRERAVLLRLAPHLLRPFPIYAPTRSRAGRVHFRLGLVAYDVLAAGRNIRRHRSVSAEEMGRAVPGLGSPSRGFRYFECATDDARLTLEVARAARAHGALVANHANVDSLLADGGRVRGAVLTDRVTGEAMEVRARVTVNAAGVWADRVHAMATNAPAVLRPSKGVHVVFRPGSVRTHVGVLVRSAGEDRRWVFVVPWGSRVYAGTTDTPYRGDLDEPRVTHEDRDYVVGAVAASFPGVTADDVVAEWAGLRPLLAGSHPGQAAPGTDLAPPDQFSTTADLSRRHAMFEDPPGLFTITGGKLTTYRAMAEELVDRVAGSLGVRAPCLTRHVALGFAGDLAAAELRAAAESYSVGLSPEVGRRMVHRFGDDWREPLRLIRRDRSLGEPVVEGLPVLRVETVLAQSREMALTDEDVLVRRTRLSTMDARATQLRA